MCFQIYLGQWAKRQTADYIISSQTSLRQKSLNKPLHCMMEYLADTFQGRYLDLYPATKYVRELRKYKYKCTKATDLADQCFVSNN